MTKAEQLIARLYTARKEHKAAKEALRGIYAEMGDCNYHDDGCSMHRDRKNCAACEAAVPLRVDWCRKANKAGAALRAALREGKRLSEEVEN